MATRLTSPVNPPVPVSSTVTDLVSPVVHETLVGVGVMENPGRTGLATEKVMGAGWIVVEPLVPVTVTVLAPSLVNVHDRTAVPKVKVVVRDTVEGVRVHGAPPFWPSVTVPVKPFVPVTVMVESPAAPVSARTLVGLAVSVTPGLATVKVTVTVWLIPR